MAQFLVMSYFMDQLALFGTSGQSPGLPKELLEYHPMIFDQSESQKYLELFISTVPWEQRNVQMYGKVIATPRLTAWYGDDAKNYAYSGNKFHPLPWTRELLDIKARVEGFTNGRFNSVLLNYYRDGNDSVAWHSDNETELGRQPLIGSVSFGEVRRFDIRRKKAHDEKFSILLEEGSLLFMKGDLQQHWEHRIAKSSKPMKARLNLTFRIIN